MGCTVGLYEPTHNLFLLKHNQNPFLFSRSFTSSHSSATLHLPYPLSALHLSLPLSTLQHSHHPSIKDKFTHKQRKETKYLPYHHYDLWATTIIHKILLMTTTTQALTTTWAPTTTRATFTRATFTQATTTWASTLTSHI